MRYIDGFGLFFLASLTQFAFQAPLPHPQFQTLNKTPDNKFMTVTICKGGRRSVGCPNMELLHVFTAFYGKFSGHDCDDPITAVRDEIPTCNAKDAAQVVRETCHGQQSCDLYAEDSLYDNPCPEVMKYLYVSYTCQGKSNLLGSLNSLEHRPLPGRAIALSQPMQALPAPAPVAPAPVASSFHAPLPSFQAPPPSPLHRQAPAEVRSVALCNGKTQSIACPNLELIRVLAAFYGKQEGRDCNGKLTRDNIPLCFAPNALATVRDTCQGQQSCDLYSEPNLYGRSTCPPVEKYLQVSYVCQGHADVAKKLAFFNRPINNKGRALLTIHRSIIKPIISKAMVNNFLSLNIRKQGPLLLSLPHAENRNNKVLGSDPAKILKFYRQNMKEVNKNMKNLSYRPMAYERILHFDSEMPKFYHQMLFSHYPPNVNMPRGGIRQQFTSRQPGQNMLPPNVNMPRGGIRQQFTSRQPGQNMLPPNVNMPRGGIRQQFTSRQPGQNMLAGRENIRMMNYPIRGSKKSQTTHIDKQLYRAKAAAGRRNFDVPLGGIRQQFASRQAGQNMLAEREIIRMLNNNPVRGSQKSQTTHIDKQLYGAKPAAGRPSINMPGGGIRQQSISRQAGWNMHNIRKFNTPIRGSKTSQMTHLNKQLQFVKAAAVQRKLNG